MINYQIKWQEKIDKVNSEFLRLRQYTKIVQRPSYISIKYLGYHGKVMLFNRYLCRRLGFCYSKDNNHITTMQKCLFDDLDLDNIIHDINLQKHKQKLNETLRIIKGYRKIYNLFI